MAWKQTFINKPDSLQSKPKHPLIKRLPFPQIMSLFCRGIHLYMSQLTSLSLKVTQSLILAAFSSIIFASWALTKICSRREQVFNVLFMNINGHFCSLSHGSVHTCFSSCVSNLFITASLSWTWLLRSWYFLYKELSDSLVCMFADLSFSSMTWIWKWIIRGVNAQTRPKDGLKLQASSMASETKPRRKERGHLLPALKRKCFLSP